LQESIRDFLHLGNADRLGQRRRSAIQKRQDKNDANRFSPADMRHTEVSSSFEPFRNQNAQLTYRDYRHFGSAHCRPTPDKQRNLPQLNRNHTRSLIITSREAIVKGNVT
jgi:hypothetical protein